MCYNGSHKVDEMVKEEPKRTYNEILMMLTECLNQLWERDVRGLGLNEKGRIKYFKF